MHHMEMDAQLLARAIGARVKHERKTRGWTLDRLADTAGISRRMLINVEQGVANPSVATLLHLSEALGVGLPALVEPPSERQAKLTRRGEGALLWSGERGGQARLVAGADRPDNVELWDWSLAPGDRHESTAHTPGTRELLQVQHGILRVHTGEESYELAPGDALSFHGDQPHAYVNDSSETTHFVLTVVEPSLGRSGGKESSHD